MNTSPDDPAPERPSSPETPPARVTALLGALRSGNRDAEGELFRVLYDELHAIAVRSFRGGSAGHTLQPTALIHDAYLKLIGPTREEGVDPPAPLEIHDREHFLNLASRVMRQVLVNHARDARAQKRGGAERRRVPLHPDLAATYGLGGPEVLDLDAALSDLAKLDPRQARVAELRIFGELTHEEIARTIGVSLRTVEGDWRMAKAWLADRLREDS